MIGRRLVAEGLGTAILVATVIGSGIMAQRLAGGNDAIALLCNTIPTGAILVVLITIFAPVSGAHFNPAVTLAFAATGDRPWREALPYIVAQCAGGILGTIVAHLMFDLAPLAIGTTARSGPSQWLAEAVATLRYCWRSSAASACAAGRALAGRADDHRDLLVHLVDIVRQSGRDPGARLHHHVRRHSDQSRPRFYRRAIGGRGDRDRGCHDAVATGRGPISSATAIAGGNDDVNISPRAKLAIPSPQRGEDGVRGLGRRRKYPASEPPHPHSLRSHSRYLGSVFFMLRTASEGRLRSPPLGRGEIPPFRARGGRLRLRLTRHTYPILISP